DSKDDGVNDRRPNIGTLPWSVWSPESFRRRPDAQGEHNANHIGEITQQSKHEEDGNRGLGRRQDVSKELRIASHDVAPEGDPGLYRSRLPVFCSSDSPDYVPLKRWMPLEPGIDRPNQAEEDT